MKEKNSLTVSEAAELMNVSKEFIRIGLQQGIFPWGYAVKMSTKYTYFISINKFIEYTGIDNEISRKGECYGEVNDI